MPITTLYMDSRLGKQAIRPVRKRHMTAWEDECALKRSARGGCQTIWVSIAGPSKASFQTNKKKTATLSAKRTRRLSYYVCRGIAPPYLQRTRIDEAGRGYNLRLRGVLLCDRFSRRGKAFSLCSMRLQEPSAFRITDIMSKRTGRSMAYIRT